ncbi:MAG: hypothetical protein HKN87_24315 [Saprospiraceae bacterium]|nr:hypothetical protein [Saprospiraceae bacterium]
MTVLENIKERILSPIQQAILLMVSCLILQLLIFIAYSTTKGEIAHLPWVISGTFVLLFAFVNALLLLKAKSINSYLKQSFYAFLSVMLLSGGMAYAFSLGDVENGGSMRFIYGAITFAYFIFLMIVFFMRKIIEYAQRQDTEHLN